MTSGPRGQTAPERCGSNRADAPAAVEAGQALVLVAVLLIGLVAVAGLAMDGGLLFSHRRTLQHQADAAALAGAMQLDEDAYRAGAVTLNIEEARRAALAALGSDRELHATVRAGATGVEVELHRQTTLGFLRVVGIDQVTIRARAQAAPRHGIGEAVPSAAVGEVTP